MKQLQYKGKEITIYEYSEARQIIGGLARQYKKDYTKVKRGGRFRGSEYYYNFPCSFDIETTTIRPGEYGYKREDGRPLGIPYLFQFNIYGAVIMVRQLKEAEEIFTWLADEFCIGEKKLIIFDHNLGYEYGFFKDVWRLDVKRCFALDEHHPVTIALDSGIMLRDSYKMTNMSLETLTKDWAAEWVKAADIMDYNARRTPFTALDNDTLIYSAIDVLSLSDAIPRFLAARSEHIWTNCPTSTSFVRVLLKNAIGIGVKHRTLEQKLYMKQLQRCKINAGQYAMLLRQARGGNTHNNRKYTGQLIGTPEGRGVVHFDIISSYPTQMVCRPEYPIDFWEELDPDCSVDTIKLFEENGYCTLFDVVLIDPKIKPGVSVPYIANSKAQTIKGMSRYSDNGRYLEGAQMLQLTLFGIEWPIIEAQYDFSDVVILGGYFARKGYLPDIIRRFVLDLYAKKTQLKNVPGREVEYSLAKTYVNGVYGMAYTKILRESFDFTPEGIRPGKPKDSEKELERFQKGTGYIMPYAWGAMTATLGRVYLQRMIDAVGDDFLYCDTDSVFAKNPERSREAMRKLEKQILNEQRKCGLQLSYADIKGNLHELGAIDEESECAFKSYGAKKYITIEEGQLHCTIAGVPKKAGARIIGSAEEFKLGMVFKGTETGKMCLWYNDDDHITLTDRGRRFSVKSNIAMLPVDYLLGLSDDYRLCLQMEGINALYSFREAQPNQNEEDI